MSDLERVRTFVSEYHAHYRNPSLSSLEVSGLYCVSPDAAERSEASSAWPETWPYAWYPGVYLIFDSNVSLLYVGKASFGAGVGHRLSAHFCFESDGSRACKVRGSWSARPAFLATIPVEEPFEAPSLEEYLIGKLQPPDNRRGING